MPAQRRYWHDERRRGEPESSLQRNNGKQSGKEEDEVERRRENGRQERRRGGVKEEEDMEAAEHHENGFDSEGTPSPTSGAKPEYIVVQLPDIRKDVQCPICLGIIKRTRTVMECLHRFCKECIDKSMRLGNNECPACRTHCASRRSLRDDPKYDDLIAALFPDIDRYEEEELAFHDEERNLNKQFQASIAEISRKQAEALMKKHPLGKDKDSGTSVLTRSQHNPGSSSRTRRNSRGRGLLVSEDNEDEFDDDGVRDSSSTDQRREVRLRKRKRRPGTRLSQPSSSAANSDAAGIENDLEEGRRESRGVSPGLVLSPDAFVWARGSARSHTRHGNKNPRNARVTKLVEHFKRLQEHNDEYVSLQTPLQAEDVEILMVKEQLNSSRNFSTANVSADKLQILDFQDTLAGVRVDGSDSRDHLQILAYREKQNNKQNP